jgi:hypothetical protein
MRRAAMPFRPWGQVSTYAMPNISSRDIEQNNNARYSSRIRDERIFGASLVRFRWADQERGGQR